jgi:hypothetical protein
MVPLPDSCIAANRGAIRQEKWSMMLLSINWSHQIDWNWSHQIDWANMLSFSPALNLQIVNL